MQVTVAIWYSGSLYIQQVTVAILYSGPLYVLQFRLLQFGITDTIIYCRLELQFGIMTALCIAAYSFAIFKTDRFIFCSS
jgi:hypothetical protein